MAVCRDYLNENGWDEGFTCSLDRGHDGPHRAEGDGIGEANEGTDDQGRKYGWTFEWVYL